MTPATLPTSPLATLDAYLALFPGERSVHRNLNAALREAGGSGMLRRDCFPGHVTTSAFVLDPAGTSAALIFHRQLQRWLQPGGHYEGDSCLVASAQRELAEETGIGNAVPVAVFGQLGVPLDVDSHPIPARTDRGEPEHVHHDFTFLFRCPDKAEVQAQLAEVEAVRWLPLREIAELPQARLRRLALKTMQLKA